MIGDTKRDREARKKLISMKLACAAEAEVSQVFENYAMRRGSELEPEAKAAFSEEMGLEVEEVGFVEMDSLYGCSPDGFVQDRQSLLEIKCPMGETHVSWLLDGELPDKHKHQVHFQMVVTGCKLCHFYSFCPGLPSLHVPVLRDRFTEDLAAGMQRLHLEYIKARRQVSEIWEQMKRDHKARKEVAA